MKDDDLATLIAETATFDRNTNAGVTALFALAKKLEGEPEFKAPRMVTAGRGTHSFSTDFAAQRMLTIARDSSNAGKGVAWLRKVSRIDRATGGAIKALYGVTCTVPVQITDSVVLMPFQSLPTSGTYDAIFEYHQRATEGLSLHGPTSFPVSGLCRMGAIEPVFTDPTASANPSPTSQWFDELDEASLMLALVPRAIPLEAAHWLHADDSDVAMLVQFGIARSGMLDVELPSFHVAPQITEAQVAGLVHQYRTLSTGDKGRVSLAIGRLLRARSQFIPGNRAIDIAIALEVLFMNSDRDEHSYKISLRAARLLRESVADRRKVFAEVRTVYDLRSAMVHAAGAKNEYNVDGVKRAAHDIVESVDVLCTEAIRRLLAMGRIPANWRDIELS